MNEKSPEQIQFPHIANELTEMARTDQEMRHTAEADETRKYWDPSVDHRNTARLKEIVAEIGWPTIAKVGATASSDAWLLVQHADHDIVFQKYCLELMQSADETEVAKGDIAYLTDRTLVNEGSMQKYGTQFYDPTGEGKYVPRPIEDPEHVAERREAMGLDTIEENTARINETAPKK